jgi:hypothetical protein
MAEDLYSELIADGFERVERDDRLLDVFPNETREKGIELWDKWAGDTVEIIRLHLPKGRRGMTRHTIPRNTVEQALQLSRVIELL